MNLEPVKAALEGVRIEDNPAIVKQKSRDFYWYSPVLKERLDHVTGDLVISPKSTEEVVRVLKACFENDVPVTTRGTGTGNYGQAMPLSGGVVLSMADMDDIVSIKPGQVVCGSGTIISKIDAMRRAPIPSRNCGSIPPPRTPRQSAASLQADRAVSGRSAGVVCATLAMSSPSRW